MKFERTSDEERAAVANEIAALPTSTLIRAFLQPEYLTRPGASDLRDDPKFWSRQNYAHEEFAKEIDRRIPRAIDQVIKIKPGAFANDLPSERAAKVKALIDSFLGDPKP